MEGAGVFTWDNGITFSGNFQAGKLDNGEFTLLDGSKVTVDFKTCDVYLFGNIGIQSDTSYYEGEHRNAGLWFTLVYHEH